jgi:hypothetical protein
VDLDPAHPVIDHDVVAQTRDLPVVAELGASVVGLGGGGEDLDEDNGVEGGIVVLGVDFELAADDADIGVGGSLFSSRARYSA